MFPQIDRDRLLYSKSIEPGKKSRLGQFFTPASIAQFMSSLFTKTPDVACKLLDPGAGIGSLSAAFLDRIFSGDMIFQSVEVIAFEIDDSISPALIDTLSHYSEVLNSAIVNKSDFVEEGVNLLQFSPDVRFTHAFLNPPYKKISASSKHRLLLRQIGLETVNLYAGFLGLSLSLLNDGGQLVAIVPRSFCNGPYYKPFRKFILRNSAIERIHLFESRNKAFSDDGVLQENVIIKLVKGANQKDVVLSTSTDDSFSDLEIHQVGFDQVVLEDDPELFIHIPHPSGSLEADFPESFRHNLSELGIDVSTGPVVDFRMSNFIQDNPDEDTVPLLYPVHFVDRRVQWPRLGGKKPNAIKLVDATQKWFFPTGNYCVVRRLTSKEERRRIIASVVTPQDFPHSNYLGFENHLNVFHNGKKGLDENLAWGLMVYLNATVVDVFFRRFNGHTQVNATDLRSLKYPSLSALRSLGDWAIKVTSLVQDDIDVQIQQIGQHVTN